MDEILNRLQEDIQLRGLRLNSEIEYLGLVKMFLEWINKPVIELTEQDFRQFLNYLIHERKIKHGSINVYNSALRFFFGVTLDQNINYRQVPRLKQIRRIPAVLTKQEVSQLLNSCDNLKHKAMLSTIYGAGLRVSEATQLRLTDIDSKTMRIFVNQGKDGKDRFTILSQDNLSLLRE